MEDTSNKHSNELNQSSSTEPKPKKQRTECKICGAPAFYTHYGVVSCDPCKVFFGRNAHKKQDLKCDFDGNCQINILNRHICSSCRLTKCFASGMQIALIRAARTTKSTTKQNQTEITTRAIVVRTRKEKDQLEQFPTINLLRADQSTLTTEQWNLISNLTHCFDEYSGFVYAQSFTEKQSKLLPKMRFKSSSVEEYFTTAVTSCQLLYEKNRDFLTLCAHDRSILISNTMKYVAGLGSCFITRHAQLLDNPAFYETSELIYGSVAMALSYRLANQLDFDGTLFKLMLSISVFSTYNPTSYTDMPADYVINVKTILNIQDLYADLIWRYLLYKYDHERAVICFSNFIRCLFLVDKATTQAYESKQYTNMIDSLVKQTEQTLTLTH